MPRPVDPDVLFVASWMEEWGMDFEISISSYYLGHFQESLAACNHLLSVEELPQEVRNMTVATRQFCLQKLEEQKRAQTMISVAESSLT